MMKTQYRLENPRLRKNGENGRWRVKSRIYVWPKGETILENLENRRSRPVSIMRPLVKQLVEELDPVSPNIMSGARYTIRWSQKAGCRCGCSPGFILDGWGPKLSGYDVHVDMVEVQS